MSCPDCGAQLVGFTVHPSLREHAPANRTGICSRCLQTVPVDAEVVTPEPAAADFVAIDDSFPSGRAGVAFALALGKLDSLALERPAIETLCEAAEREGTDVRLALERLAFVETLEPTFDISRRTEQLASFR